VFEYQFRAKILDLKIEICCHFQSLLWDQADNLTTHNGGPVSFSFAFDSFEDPVRWSLLKVCQIHGNLGLLTCLQIDSHCLHVAKTSTGIADAVGNAFRNRNVWGVKVNVVSNKELSGTYNRSPGRGMDSCEAEVRSSSGQFLDFIT